MSWAPKPHGGDDSRLSRGFRSIVFPHQIEGLKLAERARLRARCSTMLIAAVLGVISLGHMPPCGLSLRSRHGADGSVWFEYHRGLRGTRAEPRTRAAWRGPVDHHRPERGALCGRDVPGVNVGWWPIHLGFAPGDLRNAVLVPTVRGVGAQVARHSPRATEGADGSWRSPSAILGDCLSRARGRSMERLIEPCWVDGRGGVPEANRTARDWRIARRQMMADQVVGASFWRGFGHGDRRNHRWRGEPLRWMAARSGGRRGAMAIQLAEGGRTKMRDLPAPYAAGAQGGEDLAEWLGEARRRVQLVPDSQPRRPREICLGATNRSPRRAGLGVSI